MVIGRRGAGDDLAVADQVDLGGVRPDRHGGGDRDPGLVEDVLGDADPPLLLAPQSRAAAEIDQPAGEGVDRRAVAGGRRQLEIVEPDLPDRRVALVDERLDRGRGGDGVEARRGLEPDAVGVDPDAGDARLLPERDRLGRAADDDGEAGALVGDLPARILDRAEHQQLGALEGIDDVDPVLADVGDQPDGGDGRRRRGCGEQDGESARCRRVTPGRRPRTDRPAAARGRPPGARRRRAGAARDRGAAAPATPSAPRGRRAARR